MKRFAIAFIFLTAFVLFLFHISCDKHPETIPMPPPTPTPTATPVLTTILIQNNLYVPAAVTIFAGNGVIWTNTDSYGHFLSYSDVSGACHLPDNQYITNGASVTVLFPTAGTSYVHCQLHNYANCSFTSGICDATCEGGGSETGRIVIQ